MMCIGFVISLKRELDLMLNDAIRSHSNVSILRDLAKGHGAQIPTNWKYPHFRMLSFRVMTAAAVLSQTKLSERGCEKVETPNPCNRSTWYGDPYEECSHVWRIKLDTCSAEYGTGHG